MKRRNLLKIGAGTAVSLIGLNALAQLTPAQPEGPFYPVVDQLDTDADLVLVKNSSSSARGEVVIVEGVVTNQHNQSVPGVLVEIWQACESGRYNHPSDPNTAPLDPNFQYWGKAVTDINGHYKFRTIIPGSYPADTDWIRPPHIHFKVAKHGHLELITQMYFAGQELNQQDLILQRLKAEQQKDVIVEFKKNTGAPHAVGVFNIQIEKL